MKTENPVKPPAQPLCPVFGACGGCLYQNIPYEDELRLKEGRLRGLLCELEPGLREMIAPIVPSPNAYYYRNRLDLKLKRTRSNDIFIGFTPVDSKGVVPVDACYIAEKKISDFIPELKQQALKLLTSKYRNANLTVRTGSDERVLWGGIGRKSCQLAEQDYFSVDLECKRIYYSLDTFFQTNLSILPHLFEEIKCFPFWKNEPFFYDLYGGVGLFAVGLSALARQVYLIEENPSSLNVAKYNVKMNQSENVHIIEGSVEDKMFDAIERAKGAFNAVMIDPPRAGLSDRSRESLSAMQGLDAIMYLSCNPESLIRDLGTFTKNNWEIRKIIPFDFFPKTKHLETLVLLNR